jgi:two-component system chemotaxis response regulator CheB
MTTKKVVVIGTSAGGLEALRTVVAGLPPDFPAAVCVVMHTSPHAPGVLHDILGRAGRLKTVSVRTPTRLEPGTIYVAPPDFHLLVEPGRVRTSKGPKENRFRPAIDPLFRSAAQVFGPAAIGVVMTGSLDDGTAGLWTIKQMGGTAVVQDPADALFPSMPESALRHVEVDHVVPVASLPTLLVELAALPKIDEPVGVPAGLGVEINIASDQNAIDAGVVGLGTPSQYACPDCHGVLLEIKEGGRIRFRCHTGHAYSAESLIAAIDEGVEHALWTAIRAVEEAGLLMHRMADHFKDSHDEADAKRLAASAEEAHRRSNALRKIAAEREPLTVD